MASDAFWNCVCGVELTEGTADFFASVPEDTLRTGYQTYEYLVICRQCGRLKRRDGAGKVTIYTVEYPVKPYRIN